MNTFGSGLFGDGVFGFANTMPVFYSSFNDRNWVSQPNYVRSRHRYRGVRESYKFNLEISQLLYDISKLDESYDAIDSAQMANLKTLEFGGIVSSTLLDKSSQTLALMGSIQLASEIDQLLNRVKTLEGGD